MNDLRAALELATDEELRNLTEILFTRRFNPLDYFNTPDPVNIQSRSRQQRLDAVEQRFRFLAADGLTVMRRQTDGITYRQILIQVCRHLKVEYSESFSTMELEAEVFLHLLEQTWERLPAKERGKMTAQMQQALSEASGNKGLSAFDTQSLGLVLKGGTAIAASTLLRPLVRRGLTANLARFTVARSTLAVLGPALWMWLLADLGWRAIATNYNRIIPAIFALAQIRLTRADCDRWETA